MKNIIREFPIFEKLSTPEIDSVAKWAVLKEYQKGEYIFHEGERVSHLHLINRGKVKLVKHTPQGKDVIVNIATDSEPLNLESIADDGQFPTSAVAAESTSVFMIEKSTFRKLIAEHPSICFSIGRALSALNREHIQKIKELSVAKVDSRIASMILRLGEKIGQTNGGGDNHITIDIHLSRQDIADMSGTTVESAIRAMSRFGKNQLVKTTKDRIVIEDRDRLEEIAQMY